MNDRGWCANCHRQVAVCEGKCWPSHIPVDASEPDYDSLEDPPNEETLFEVEVTRGALALALGFFLYIIVFVVVSRWQ